MLCSSSRVFIAYSFSTGVIIPWTKEKRLMMREIICLDHEKIVEHHPHPHHRLVHVGRLPLITLHILNTKNVLRLKVRTARDIFNQNSFLKGSAHCKPVKDGGRAYTLASSIERQKREVAPMADVKVVDGITPETLVHRKDLLMVNKST